MPVARRDSSIGFQPVQEMTVTAYDVDRLTDDLVALGVEQGDTIFMHSSFKSIGPVEGGAATVIEALNRAVGPDGLIMMPSFNLKKSNDERAESWDIETSPATTGYITEFFRTMPGTYRSDHYSHSVAARGKGAREIVSGHLGREGMKSPWDREPWGKSYGVTSPMMLAYDAGGKILMMSVNYLTSTYIHVMEVSYWNHMLKDDGNADYRWFKKEEIGEYWDEGGKMSRKKVGDSDCRLFRMRDYVDTMLGLAVNDIETWAKSWN